jgi:hypothetical protein
MKKKIMIYEGIKKLLRIIVLEIKKIKRLEPLCI